jgi:hypothetical protein
MKMSNEIKYLPIDALKDIGTVNEPRCICGHAGERHEIEPPYPCYECSCEIYTVTNSALPPPEDAFSSQAPFQLNPTDFEDDELAETASEYEARMDAIAGAFQRTMKRHRLVEDTEQ